MVTFAFGPLSIHNAATRSSSDYRVDLSTAPTKFFRLVFYEVCHEFENLDLLTNPGQKDHFAGLC